MEKIDPEGLVSACLHRTHCTFYQNELYVKVKLCANPSPLQPSLVTMCSLFDRRCVSQDLSRLGRDLPNTILLDNNADCYLFQPQNAIPINSWYDDKTVDASDPTMLSLCLTTWWLRRTRTWTTCLASWM